jgi:hypothetical protein
MIFQSVNKISCKNIEEKKKKEKTEGLNEMRVLCTWNRNPVSLL